MALISQICIYIYIYIHVIYSPCSQLFDVVCALLAFLFDSIPTTSVSASRTRTNDIAFRVSSTCLVLCGKNWMWCLFIGVFFYELSVNSAQLSNNCKAISEIHIVHYFRTINIIIEWHVLIESLYNNYHCKCIMALVTSTWDRYLDIMLSGINDIVYM